MVELLTRVHDFIDYFVLEIDATTGETTLTSRWVTSRHLTDHEKFKIKIVDTSLSGEDGVFIRTPQARMNDLYLKALEEAGKRGYDFAIVSSKFEYQNVDHFDIRRFLIRTEDYKTKDRWTRSLEDTVVFCRSLVNNF